MLKFNISKNQKHFGFFFSFRVILFLYVVVIAEAAESELTDSIYLVEKNSSRFDRFHIWKKSDPKTIH